MKVVVFFSDGFEECEALIVVDILRRAGITVVIASTKNDLEVFSSRNIVIKADAFAEEIDFDEIDMIVLPGGRTGIENLYKSRIVRKQCYIFTGNKFIAAICSAPVILARLGLLEGKKVTCHPDYINQMKGAIVLDEKVVISDKIITANGLGSAFSFALGIVGTILGEESVQKIKREIIL